MMIPRYYGYRLLRDVVLLMVILAGLLVFVPRLAAARLCVERPGAVATPVVVQGKHCVRAAPAVPVVRPVAHRCRIVHKQKRRVNIVKVRHGFHVRRVPRAFVLRSVAPRVVVGVGVDVRVGRIWRPVR
jgi:hypothetical protein